MSNIKQKLQEIIANGHTGDTVTIYGEKHDLAELAKTHGITLPTSKKAKKQVNTDIQESEHADMEQPHTTGDTEES